MEIKNIQLRTYKKTVRLSATIQFKEKKTETIYFTLDKEYADFIVADASAFLAALFLPAMKMQNDIIINGSVSSLLLSNTKKVTSLFSKWNMKWSTPEIKTYHRKDSYPTPKFVGCFFSGGVDSFYTLIKNQKSSKDKISHFILVHGFDIDINNESFFTIAAENVKRIAKENNIKVIVIKTNIKDVIEKYLVWDFSHGGALAAVALLLRRKISTVYIAGSLAWSGLFPYGTHPELDPLWGTEKLQIIHDGNERTRVQKLKDVVSHSGLAQKYLRVCNQNLKGSYNCCRCFKCLKTMCEIVAAGNLHAFKTFPEKLDLNRVRNMYFDYKANYNLLGEEVIDTLVAERRDLDVVEALLFALEKSKYPSKKQKIIKLVAAFDQKYNNRRIYRTIFKLNADNDRNIVFKYLAEKGIIK